MIGTSSIRRRALIKSAYGDKLTLKDIRGNLNTRLAKLDSKQYDAIVLAKVGLQRLGEYSVREQKVTLITYNYYYYKLKYSDMIFF